MARENRKQRRSEAFFGRRKAKGLSPRAQCRFDEIFPKYCLDLSLPVPMPVSGLFANQPEQIILEIGIGGGEHLIHQALANPANGYIGVEPFINSMAKVLRVLDEHKIENIRLYDEDAVELLDWLPANALDRIDLMYPDPWPKMRHWKRRFVNPKNLQRFGRVLKKGGRFHFASDIESYVNWTLQHCARNNNFQWLANNVSDWHTPFENWTGTRYETKAFREGRTSCYLKFMKTDQ